MDDAEPSETIWAPQQVGVTVLVTLPAVLALLPQEVGRLESAIDEVCTARSVSFSVSR